MFAALQPVLASDEHLPVTPGRYSCLRLIRGASQETYRLKTDRKDVILWRMVRQS